ncbi:Ditrans,polycis-undecaprenyl-diphosphate synthase ((2E,6E)-farnesyl-diphosphate specific) [bioreactor metagenome]|uniref:Ditrans,polycis-undecaprenyl-diphosphate synthase ((2E,6E)-farnesyl-diphosphate specific) n=1 Tax=bioreactor metagenome TaxID=1076179 RepID=A0A645IM31_9ZZZZ
MEYLTVYAFSTENWKRSKSEVSFLFALVSDLFEKYIDELINNRVKVNIVGLENNVPPKVWKTLKKAELMSKEGDLLKVNIAFNYGGTEDILHAVKSIAQKVEDGSINIDNIDVKTIEKNLISKDVGPIDLLIRTSGELRISNFLLWQLAYTEMFFSDKLWPDFSESDLIDAIYSYCKRDRRFGGRK